MKKIHFYIIFFLLFICQFIKLKAEHDFGGALGFKLSKSAEQNYISLGFDIHGFSHGKPNRYLEELNFLTFTLIDRDRYNNNKVNYSAIDILKFAYLLPISLYGLAHEHSGDKTIEYLLLPYQFFDSRFGYIFLDFNTNTTDFILTTAFIKSKFDYFFKHEVQYCRYMPGVGIETGYIFNQPGSNDYGLFLCLGIDYQIDFVNGKTLTRLIPAFTIKFVMGKANEEYRAPK